MTGEEMQRALEFLANNQADLEAQVTEIGRQVAETNRQLAETNRQLQAHAETQTQFMGFVKQHIEAQGEINAAMRATDRRLAEAVARMAEAVTNVGEAVANVGERGAQTDARLDRLAESQARADELRAQSDARLDRLAAIIERHVSDGHGV